MGAASVKQELEGVTQRTEQRAGKIAVSGRYHRLPKRLEDDYAREPHVLGTGYNGQVNLFLDRRSTARCAVKSFKLQGVDKEKRKEIRVECEVFLSMDHPHVVRLLDVYESEEQLDLVMECMDGGELFDRVASKKKPSEPRPRLPERDAANATSQMLLALNYIHGLGVVHRDLKLENFMCESKEGNHLKLIDFGFSKFWSPKKKMASSCGTLAYVAPEVLGHRYTSQCDLWSLGVIVFILVFGYTPFQRACSEDARVADRGLAEQITKGFYTIQSDQWRGVSADAKDFVTKLLVVDPATRLTAHRALRHNWIRRRDEIAMREPQIDEAVLYALKEFANTSAFRRACMAVMAWSLRAEEHAKVRDAFLDMDSNHDGVISLPELKKVLKDRLHMEDNAIVEAFNALDVSGCQQLHYCDFLSAMVSSGPLPIDDNLLQQTFRRFDTDGSGHITKLNLQEVLGKTFKGHEVDGLFSEADFNHDGQISFHEFTRYVKDGEVEAPAAPKIADDCLGPNVKSSPHAHVPRLMQAARNSIKDEDSQMARPKGRMWPMLRRKQSQ